MAAIGSSLWFGRGFGAHNASCLDVTCQIPIIARQPLPICLGCVAIVGSHFWFCHGFDSRYASCLAVLCRIPLLACQPDLSLLGVGRAVMSSDGVLDDLIYWG